MNVLVIRFKLAGISASDYLAMTEKVAPTVAQAPGLVQKAWLANDEDGVYGGAYIFTDRESIEAYLGSEIGQGIRNSGLFEDLSIEVFDTIEPATSITFPCELAIA